MTAISAISAKLERILTHSRFHMTVSVLRKGCIIVVRVDNFKSVGQVFLCILVYQRFQQDFEAVEVPLSHSLSVYVLL